MQEIHERALPIISEVPESPSNEFGPTEEDPSDSSEEDEAPPWSVLTELVTYAPSFESGIGISTLPPPVAEKVCTPPSHIPELPADPGLVYPFENVFAEIKDQTTFDESKDISITYIGETALEHTRYIPNLSCRFDYKCHMMGHIATGDAIDVLVDTGATKSYLS